jgi:hypothetical protein
MSSQLAIGFVQPDDSKSGQLVRVPQPIEASGSSSALPQTLSMPPHDFAMLDDSLVPRIVRIVVTVGWLAHTVVGGNWPLVFPSSHLSSVFVRPCTYLADALANARWHLSGSATAAVDTPRTIVAISAATNERRAWLVMSFPPSCTNGLPPPRGVTIHVTLWAFPALADGRQA